MIGEHARFWAENSPHDFEEAFTTLKFLRSFFAVCSKTDTALLQANGLLQKRIGLLKQHADRAAAHLTLQDYEIEIVDLAHFTAATVMIGELIRRFDDPLLGPKYFNGVDRSSYEAARQAFPDIPTFQLFANVEIERQALIYCAHGEKQGVDDLLNRVQFILG